MHDNLFEPLYKRILETITSSDVLTRAAEGRLAEFYDLHAKILNKVKITKTLELRDETLATQQKSLRIPFGDESVTVFHRP